MRNLEFLIGADPEIFVKSGDTLSSVAGLLGCSKYEKLALPDGINLQEDNVLVEFDIPPVTNFTDFDRLIVAGIDHCSDAVAKHGLELARGISSHVYTDAELKTFAESAFTFGCEPDYNALTGIRNDRPSADALGLRTGGGHVHIGISGLVEINPLRQRQAIILCDYLLGLPSLLMDADDRRRELYGKASAMRFKPYGVEYRTLSNHWIFERELREHVYRQVEKVVEMTVEGSIQSFAQRVSPEVVAQAINSGDRRMAEQITRQLSILA